MNTTAAQKPRHAYTCVAERVPAGTALAEMSSPQFTHIVVRHRPNRADDTYLYRESDEFLRKIVTDPTTGVPTTADPTGWVDRRMWSRITGALARLRDEEAATSGAGTEERAA